MNKVLLIIQFFQLQYAIHSHLLVCLGELFWGNDPTTKKLFSDFVCDLYDTSNYYVAYIDHFINQTYNPSDDFKDDSAAYVV